MTRTIQKQTDRTQQAISSELFRFYDYLSSQGCISLSVHKAEEAAGYFSRFFGIVCPMGTSDTRTLLERMKYCNVYLQPGLERRNHARGFWGVEKNQILILLDAARPDPSKIKTLLHEIAEMMLEICYGRNPNVVRLDDKKREDWANKFAAFVKMPRDLFMAAFQKYGVDLESLCDEFAETFAGVSRHIRDLCLPDRPFYFGRVSLENNPERHCSDLVPHLEKSGGICVYVADAAKSRVVDWKRHSGGALPVYNVGKMRQFRIMHPRLRLYTLSDNPSEEPPMLIPRLRASAGGADSSQLDLFDQDLAMMIFPMGKGRRLSGFFVVGVHHSDIGLFNQVRDRICASRQADMDWLFSWEKEEYTRVPDEMDEDSEQPDLTPFWEDNDLSEEEQAKQNRSRWLVGSGEDEEPKA